MKVTNTLAYYRAELITDVRSYIVQALIQCYKTFYVRNFLVFVLNLSKCLFLIVLLQHSLMFVSQAGAYPREATIRCSTQV
jgi:hypothetical protein